VFSSPRWDTDHVTVQVANNGNPIAIVAWIDSPSKKVTVSVDAGETTLVSTPLIQAQNGQILKFGFEAYENDTPIDTYSATITVSLVVVATPTSLPPETVTISGTVVDSASGAPVPGAKVTFLPEGIDRTYGPVAADDSGFFSSPRMYAGVRYTIKVSAAGYQAISSITDDKISEDSTASIPITKLATGATPTPGPSPTPASPLDAWASLLYSPITCLGTLTAMVTAIGGSIGIYEWMEKRRDLRMQEKNEPPGNIKKP
jgi:hypothetical protein